MMAHSLFSDLWALEVIEHKANSFYEGETIHIYRDLESFSGFE